MTQTRSRYHRPEVTSVGVPARTTFRLEELEAREVPAIAIQIDYSYDTGFFTNNPAARAVMEQAATELGNSISANLSAITPSGGNTWTATFTNPTTGAATSAANLSIGANTIKVFVGAGVITSGPIAWGTTGGTSSSGSADWVNIPGTRGGWTGFSPWGGDIEFDSRQNWYFGQTTAGLTSDKLGFYSVARHELGRILGIGTSSQWLGQSSGGAFHGANAMAVYGGPVPETSSASGWATGVTVNGVQAAMDPATPLGQRVEWSALDAAALLDLGWVSAAAPTPSAATPAPVAAATVPAFVGLSPGTNSHPVAVTGSDNGTASLFVTSGSTLTPTGQTLTPFAGYAGAIRVASGDFNGDGVTDYVFTTGAGPQAVVEIVNGRDGSLLVGQTAIFPGFCGGLFVAAGDIDRDGIADLIVSADAGAGPHIQTFRVVNGGLQSQSSFFAFDNPSYTGGARVAAGDINHDGCADVVVTTGGGAEGRVAVYSGADLRRGVATRLVPDFIPFAGFWGALNVAVGDMNGDGYAELAIAPDVGGQAHVEVWSGATLTANPSTPVNRLAPVASFFAFSPAANVGARLALRDTDGNGRAELVAGSGDPQDGAARVFTFDALANPAATPETHPLGTPAGGIYVG